MFFKLVRQVQFKMRFFQSLKRIWYCGRKRRSFPNKGENGMQWKREKGKILKSNKKREGKFFELAKPNLNLNTIMVQ